MLITVLCFISLTATYNTGLVKFQVETLRYEQERLLFLRENAKLEQEKLGKDVILADIEIEKARHELELLKRRRQM